MQVGCLEGLKKVGMWVGEKMKKRLEAHIQMRETDWGYT